MDGHTEKQCLDGVDSARSVGVDEVYNDIRQSHRKYDLEAHHVKIVKRENYEKYIWYKVRLQSFSEWPKYLVTRPRDLATAGFFYVGVGDIVLCFDCGVRLKNWEPVDKVWREQSNWSPNCEIICMVQML